MPVNKNSRITVRLFDNQPEMLHELSLRLNTSGPDVMRKALEELFTSTFEGRNQCAFVVELGEKIESWLGNSGFSYNLGANQRNASKNLGDIPFKFTTRRGGFDE